MAVTTNIEMDMDNSINQMSCLGVILNLLKIAIT